MMVLLRIIFVIVLCYVMVVALMYVVQRQQIYFPNKSQASRTYWGASDMNKVKLKTKDGLHLIAWYKPAASGKATILYMHGNAHHYGSRVAVVRPYINQGYGVLLFSYRGYSDNPGTPNEKGLNLDALAAMQYLKQQAIPSQCIVLYGESLGAALAVKIAKQDRVGAIVLQAPFTSLVAIGKKHFFWLPVQWLLHDRYEVKSIIANINTPVLIVHGLNDWIVPVYMGKQVYDAAKQPKQIRLYQGLGHNDLNQAALYDDVMRFMQYYVTCPQQVQE